MPATRLLGGLFIFATVIFYYFAASANTGEVGQVTVSQNGANQWHTVSTIHNYENPVVVMGPPTDQDNNPVTVRVRNVTSSGFQFQLDRWVYLSDSHGEETLSYLIVESGSFILANGARIEAGIQSGVTTDSFTHQNLSSGFTESPVLLAQVVTVKKSGPVTIQLHDIRTDRFSSRLLVEEARKSTGHGAENVAWVAIETSTLGGTRQYVAGVSDREIGHIPLAINFGRAGFSSDSPFFCNQRSFNDSDPASLRYQMIESSSAVVYQQEDRSQNNEILHEVSKLSFAVFKSAGDIPFIPNPPTAKDDEISMNPLAMVYLDVLANDFDPEDDLDTLSLSMNSDPAYGTVTVDESNGRITYTNTDGTQEFDEFSYTVKDSRGAESNDAKVTVTIDSSDRLPNTTLDLPASIPLSAYKLENALPGLQFQQPVNMAIPPGETERIFIVQKRGKILVVDDLTSPTPTSQVFLDLSSDVSTIAERGLMSLAFHPDYANNGTFFVVYSDNKEPKPNPYPGKPTRHSILSRFQVLSNNPNKADRSSETILIRQIDRDSGHQGGDLEFGPDGYLYISTGDEGSQTDVYKNTQTITKNFFSGILRIDIDNKPENLEPNPHVSVMTDGEGLAYFSVPADNPWVGATEFEGVPFKPDDVVRTEFYAVGLRNPWQMSFDPLNGELWVGDVGKGSREEVDKIVAGGNYQWAYREGNVDGPKASSTPAGFTGTPPVYDYPRPGSPASVIGGIVYRGSKLPDLTGAYIFGDHGLNKIWSLREEEGGGVTVDIVAYEGGVTSFLADPNNGDVLVADFEGKIWRLVEDTTVAPAIPESLAQTGAFADLTTLTPNPGIYAYHPNLRFWSDHAHKTRWFSIPDAEDKMVWKQDDPWDYPKGMIFLKHFDLEMERGNPATKQRIETRFLVLTEESSYGLSYQWNEDQTDAVLVPTEGLLVDYTIEDAGKMTTQTWQFPGRAECLQCHTTTAGRALSFNTRQLNKIADIFGTSRNQLEALEEAGFFSNEVDSVSSLPHFVTLGEESQSLEARVRSYLAVNCISCHQPGAGGSSTWDARPELSLDETGLINGIVSNYGDNPNQRLIIPGNLDESVLLNRISGCCGFTRMPPLATSILDEEAIQLVSEWIMSLDGYQSYQEWRLQHFESDTDPDGGKNLDADSDGFSNYTEFLTKTNPQDSTDYWSYKIELGTDNTSFEFDHLANLSFLIETSDDLNNWEVWNVDGNTTHFPVEDLLDTKIQGSMNDDSNLKQFYRWRIREP